MANYTNIWNKGLTKETDIRIAKGAQTRSQTEKRYYANSGVNAFTGKHHKKKTKKKLSKITCQLWKDGVITGMSGRKHTPETIQKMRNSHIGKVQTKEQRAKNFASNKKVVHTAEWNKNVSESLKGREGHPQSQETRKKISLSNTGKKRSPITGMRISKALMGRVGTMTGKHHSKESIRKISASNIEPHKVLWQDPEYVKKQMRARNVKPNKAEKKLNRFLHRILPNEYKFVGDGEFILAGKCPDFLNMNGQKKLIELYGDYWHRNDNPQDRIDLFSKYGYKTLIIWERELKPIRRLKEKILKFNTKNQVVA